MRVAKRLSVAALVLLAPLALAGTSQDYARQWALTLGQAEAGAYRVALEADVYRSSVNPSLADIEVFNAQGEALPAAVLSPSLPLAQSTTTLELAWFALPQASPSAGGGDLQVVAERDADGSIRRVQLDTRDTRAASQAGQWLIDASHLREPVHALRLEWQLPAQPLDISYRVEGSNDLRQWRTLNGGTALLDLERDGQRLRQGRIVLDGQARYLRLVPLRQGQGPELSAVLAELAPVTAQAHWEWQEVRGERVSEGGREYFLFQSPGRFPVERVDVLLAGNNALEWTLQSREQADANWTWRAGPWMAFQVGGNDGGSRSPPQPLQGTVRDRYWRLSAKSGSTGQEPVLKLGYRPEVVVFLAQGEPPYTLAAGSGRGARAEAPIPALLAALREQRGALWQPSPAYLAAQAQELAGEAALNSQAPIDWKSWLLWSLLVGGALLVGLLGLSLLRQKPSSD